MATLGRERARSWAAGQRRTARAVPRHPGRSLGSAAWPLNSTNWSSPTRRRRGPAPGSPSTTTARAASARSGSGSSGGRPASGSSAWSLRGLPDGFGGALDGLPTDATDDPPCEPAEHANGATAIDHVVVAHARHRAHRRRPRSMPASRSAAPARSTPSSTGSKAIQTFFRLGEPIFELLGPLEPSDGPAGFFGLAYTVSDLDALADRYGPALGRVKDAVQPGRRIATLRHKDLGLSVADRVHDARPRLTTEPVGAPRLPCGTGCSTTSSPMPSARCATPSRTPCSSARRSRSASRPTSCSAI